MYVGKARRLWHPVVLDAAVGLLLVGASVQPAHVLLTRSSISEPKMITLYGSEAALQTHRILWYAAACSVVIALIVRRHWPLWALVLSGAAATAVLVDANLPKPALTLAVPLTLFTFASRSRSRWTSGIAFGAAVVAGFALVVHRQTWLEPGLRTFTDTAWQRSTLSACAVPLLVLGIAWIGGDYARTRRLHAAMLEERATELERERDQRALLAVAAERARIMRELHDVVAHGISVMVVQTQGAAATVRSRPERSIAALDEVVTVGRASLAEMRRLLGLSRSDGPQETLLAPQPGVAALPTLIDRIREAGVPVTLHVEGDPNPLPAGVDLSAYRIVQEALTNTLKHAGAGARATVHLAFEPDRLAIEVADDGTGPTNGDGAAGTGLRSIAERAAALDGTVDLGNGADGGFVVRVRLPLGQR
jgi:signal transduction histidine kinase